MTDLIQVAQRHDDAFNARDANGRMEIEAPDIEVIMPGGMTLRGPEQVIEVVKLFWEALPDGKIIAQNRFAAGDSVVAEGTLRGTHRGTFRAPSGEIPPTGNSVTLRYATIKRIQGGRLVSEHLYFDQLEFLQQLGVFPTPRP